MVQIIKFDSQHDIAEVDQFGFVDINKAFQNGYVPGENSSVVLEYNNIEEPSSIVGKPSDAFEAMRMQDSLVKGIQTSSKKDDK